MVKGRKDSLFAVPEIKEEYFHNNRSPTIDIPQFLGLYILQPFFLLCVHLSNNISEGGQRPTLPAPRHDGVPATFNACECTAIHTCGQRPFTPLRISLYNHVYCR